VSTLTWLSLVFLLLVLAGTSVYLVTRVFAAWRSLTSLEKALTASLATLDASVARLDRRMTRVNDSQARLASAQARLQRSLATTRVLTGAAREAMALVGAVRAFVPTK
jgi:hypothetical protein